MWEGGGMGGVLGALTPKFYVALTGTSSLISGLILMFEWWYFRRHGVSFIEQVSLTHLGPWLGGESAPVTQTTSATDCPAPPPTHHHQCKVWRNESAWLRGAEYGRVWAACGIPPLTYYDMNLTAQEHQASLASPTPDAADEAIARAWREREPPARLAAARRALSIRPDCAAAILLLAEEHAPTVAEAERGVKRAWRAAEARREMGVANAAKRRAAWCARRLGRLREAARLYRELHAHECLLEVLLEQHAWTDAAALTARLERADEPTATALYTAALLRARAGAEKAARLALRAAVAHNPHVPEYLLEMKPLQPPPEHVARGGRSEALAYAVLHIKHWQSCEPALKLLSSVCSLTGPSTICAGCAGGADGELLPSPHPSPTPSSPRRATWAAAACSSVAAIAFVAHRWGGIGWWGALDPRSLLSAL